MKTLRQRLANYIQSTRRAAKGNMEMSVTRKGQLCSERHKVILRNIAMEQTRTADQLEQILTPKRRNVSTSRTITIREGRTDTQ